MNGKRSKMLRRMSSEICKHQGIKLGDGYRIYNRADNRMDLKPVINDDGQVVRDQDGLPLMKPALQPGTITNAWKWRIIYLELKKRWKQKLQMQ